MSINNYILNYDVFIFDFDGTIMNTEKYHCLAWNKALQQYLNDSSININITEFQKYFHNLNNNHSKVIIKTLYNIDDYESLYKLKQHHYNILINSETIEFINGALDFLTFLLFNNKKFVIVSNTSLKSIEIFKNKFPILNHAYNIYTKEYYCNKKPNPECYLKVMNDFKNEKKIGFEDSLIGMHALYQVYDIIPILIYDNHYFHTNTIIKNYPNIIKLENYNINQLNLELSKVDRNIFIKDKLFICDLLNNNMLELLKNFSNMEYIINSVSILLKNINIQNNIYLTGMGKSGYVCKKCASTWQSLSIKASYIDLPNLPHGDFGIFRDGDILLLISNGGNTSEIIYILKYLKDILKKNINTISIIANKNSEMEKYSNFTFILDNIKEGDLINMTPSTSSLIFMSILDNIGINMKKNITKDEFKLYHPNGSLGNR
jgi:D-arabinose 5-phosphate isomerase GutQ/beta-phosphoglucomutase-like phosphatase (HAD superfamily)